MSVNAVRFKFFKKDEFKYLSHLDVLALMERALMRTGIQLACSSGFHPKLKLSFSNPIPLGVQSLAEYCDIELLEEISPEDFTVLINSKLPDNLKVIQASSFEKTPENKIPSLMSAIDIVLYEYKLLFKKLLPERLLNEKPSEKKGLKGKKAIEGSLSFDKFKSPFLKDFKELFGPAGKNEECEADLLNVKNSIYNYEAAASGLEENIFFLKICGYAKISKQSNNSIFKFNVFNKYFEKFLKTADIEIWQVQKTGTYILKDNILTDPIQVISTKGSEV